MKPIKDIRPKKKHFEIYLRKLTEEKPFHFLFLTF